MACPYYDKGDFKSTLKEAANQDSKFESYIAILTIFLSLIIGLLMFFVF
jgi:hypothetical protein